VAVVDLAHAREQGFTSGVNNYCPQLIGCAQMGLNNEKVMDLAQPTNLAVAGILSAVAVGATYTPTDFLGTGDLVGGKFVSTPWGREVDFVLSGAGTNQVDIYGRDYLGQPVHKTLTGNGATRVPTGVALRWLDRIVVATGGGLTLSVGYTNRLGMEYRTIAVITEFADLVKATAGTLDGPNVTDPQTVAVPGTSSDPRGLYTPTTTPDGVKNLWLQTLLLPVVNINGNGGLHGIQHFGA
jgi:hypothetical protein